MFEKNLALTSKTKDAHTVWNSNLTQKPCPRKTCTGVP